MTSPDMFIDPGACWWITLTRLDQEFLSEDPKAQACYLSQPEHAFLARMAALRLAVDEGYPSPIGLTFQEFQEQWTRGPSIHRALTAIAMSEPLPTLPAHIIEEVKHEQRPPPPQWLVPADKARVIRTNTDVFQDHGFHQLMFIRHDSRRILGMINHIRRETSTPITGEEIALGILDCSECGRHNFAASSSPPGVYYAPPGMGKSTALKYGWFVGIDTDWLIHSSNYQTVIKPFVEIGLPVLTNQYHLACHSGERFFGFFNPKKLRLDPKGPGDL